MSVREPIRVLQINSGSKHFGGVSSLIYNVYSHIDRKKIQFDFLSPNITTYGIHREEIEKDGGKLFELGIKGNILTKKLKLYSRLKRFLQDHPYSIVHINSGNFFFNLFAAKAAKDAGTKFIYIHSHNTENPKSSLGKKSITVMLKPVLAGMGNRLFACSREASEYMFGNTKKEVDIVRNGIVVERFEYNGEIRNRIREELGVTNQHVIGHVGRFTEQKNHEFIIDVFVKLAQIDKRAVLLLIGEGEVKGRVSKRIQEEKLEDRVIILNTQKAIEKYYQAMDVFLFPSKWEGLGMVLVEAQISGLPCIASENVPREAAINNEIKFCTIDNESIDLWIDTIISAYDKQRETHTADALKCGYSIKAVAAKLESYYLQDAKKY